MNTELTKPVVFPLVAAITLALAGCGPSPEEVAQKVEPKLRAEMKKTLAAEMKKELAQTIKKELAVEMKKELAALESRLREELKSAVPAAATEEEVKDGEQEVKDGEQEAKDGEQEAKDEPADPSAKPLGSHNGLTVSNLVLAGALDGNRPQNVSSSFSTDLEKIYCHVEAANPDGPKRKLVVIWYHGEQEYHRARLTVGKSKTWRTWAYIRPRRSKLGNWRCALHTAELKLLAQKSFTVK